LRSPKHNSVPCAILLQLNSDQGPYDVVSWPQVCW